MVRLDGAPLRPWPTMASNGSRALQIPTRPFYSQGRQKEASRLSVHLCGGLSTVVRAWILQTKVQKLNGVTIQRRGCKHGTRPVPTAELRRANTRTGLVGTLGQGTKEISTILNATRVHDAVSACGLGGRGLVISRVFARARYVRGTSSIDLPAGCRTMAKWDVEYRANMQLMFSAVALLGTSEQSVSSQASVSSAAAFVPKKPAPMLPLRVLTPTMKALMAKAAISGLGNVWSLSAAVAISILSDR